VAIAALDYRPSAVARGLSTKQTHAIGVVIADVTAPFFARFLKAVEELLTIAGYSIVVINTYEDAAREADGLERLRQRRVDGIVITPTGAPQDSYAGLASDGCPVVFVERMPPGAAGALAASDNRAAVEECTHYLHELGHRRIALLTLDEATTAVSARSEGFDRARRALGLDPDPQLVAACGPTIDTATAVVERLLALDPPPTALIAGNHVASMGALRAVRRAGLRIPDDISIIVFDNSPWTEVMDPPLTAVTKPIEELARRAVSELLGSIEAGRRPSAVDADADLAPASVMLPATLHRRGSCAPPEPSRSRRKEAAAHP
jgi:LacI family transcriptional regulator